MFTQLQEVVKFATMQAMNSQFSYIVTIRMWPIHNFFTGYRISTCM